MITDLLANTAQKDANGSNYCGKLAEAIFNSVKLLPQLTINVFFCYLNVMSDKRQYGS